MEACSTGRYCNYLWRTLLPFEVAVLLLRLWVLSDFGFAPTPDACVRLETAMLAAALISPMSIWSGDAANAVLVLQSIGEWEELDVLYPPLGSNRLSKFWTKTLQGFTFRHFFHLEWPVVPGPQITSGGVTHMLLGPYSYSVHTVECFIFTYFSLVFAFCSILQQGRHIINLVL